VCEVQIVQLLTVSGNVQRLLISHNMTTGTGMLLSLAGTAAASWRHVLHYTQSKLCELSDNDNVLGTGVWTSTLTRAVVLMT